LVAYCVQGENIVSAAADSGGAACDAVSAADSGGVPGALVDPPAVLPPAPRTFGDGAIELRVGRWQEALADVSSVDVLITDPPYSERTHAGHDTGTRDANAVAKAVGRRKGDGSLITVARASRRALGYECWTADDVAAFVAAWAPRTRGWFVAITDHVLSPAWESALEAADRYVFAPLQYMAPGSRVRIGGDGPALWSTSIVVARPRNRSFQQWGSLPGGYVLPSGQNATHNQAGIVIGGKPLWLMQALIRDYSRPGDLICDPCAGGATTLLAAAIEGRRGIGAEMDPATYALACKRLGRGYTPNMFTHNERARAANGGRALETATQHDLDLGITTTR
jgi:site-specific DNA-methyltransferase (adenine-specific)